MRNLAVNDIVPLERILRDTGAFTPAEVECAVELLEIVIFEPGQKDYRAYVADHEGAAAGYVLFGPTPLTTGCYDVYWLATAPDLQGRGLARGLMAGVETEVRERGGRLICLETSSQPGYRRARMFYERSGYREEARIRDFYRIGDDRITYVKRFDRMEGNDRDG